jgi:hypothetical protein
LDSSGLGRFRGRLVNTVMKFWIHNRQRISWSAECLFKDSFSMELISLLVT